MTTTRKRWLTALLVLVLAAGGYLAWQKLGADSLPSGIASGNGRIEAAENRYRE
jgi:HlyD family secretion protein